MTLQQEEVQAVKWASREEIIDMIRNGEFITYYESLIDMIFDMRGGYGAHSNEDRK